MFEISMIEKSRQIKKHLPCLAIALSLSFSQAALSQDLQPPIVNDHDIEIVEPPFNQLQPFSQSGWSGGLGMSRLGGAAFGNIPYVGSVPFGGGVPYVPALGIPRVPSLSIPYVGGLGGLSGLGGLIRHGWGGSYSDPYRLYRAGSSFGNFGGYSSFGSSYPSSYSWARPFGRLTGQSIIQTGPSKAAGNYYAPATADPTEAGNYYASEPSVQKTRNQVFDKDYQDYNDYKRTRPSYGNSDHTKPQRDYWGGSGSPFPKDLNSTPWSK